MGCICSVAQSTGGAHQGAHSQQPLRMSMYGQGVGLLDFCYWSYLIINISSNIIMCRGMGLLDFWKMTLLCLTLSLPLPVFKGAMDAISLKSIQSKNWHWASKIQPNPICTIQNSSQPMFLSYPISNLHQLRLCSEGDQSAWPNRQSEEIYTYY